MTLQSYKVQSFAITDIGCVRKKNEDAFLQLPEEGFYVVADGLGGHKGGDIAANEAVKSVCYSVKRIEQYQSKDRTPKELAIQLRFAIKEANHLVNRMSNSNESYKGMATTLSCLYLFKDHFIFAHIGDSRIYRLRKEHLQQLTKDHSVVNELITLGKITPEEALTSPYKNIVTKAIGIHVTIEPDVKTDLLQEGDIYLLCSDGLSDCLSRDEIEKILCNLGSLETAAQDLVDLAKNKGGGIDNITLIIIKIDKA